MKTLGKALVAGGVFLAGYFVGFYEMKYKTMRALLFMSNKQKEEEESQK